MTGTLLKSKSLDGSNTSSFLVHISLCTAHAIFGISAVIGSIGLPSFHPLTFVLIRGICATMILLPVAHFYSIFKGREEGIFSGSMKDWSKFAISGFGIFGAQVFFIIGLKLSNAVAASVWQPSQPIITAAVCMILGWEPLSLVRCAGILVAFVGCAIMVLGDDNGGEAGWEFSSSGKSSFSYLMGQFSFLLNCCALSLYVLSTKHIVGLGRYEPVAITAWSYAAALLYMLLISVLTSLSDTISSFLCPDCGGNMWHVPKSAVPAIIFFVLFTSCTVYGLITWANKYATGTLVIGYTAVQPVASAVVIQLLIMAGFYKGCQFYEELDDIDDLYGYQSDVICLDQPDKYTAIGAIGVFAGLLAIIHTEPKKDDNDDDTVNTDMDYTGLEEEATIFSIRGSSSDGSNNSCDDKCVV